MASVSSWNTGGICRGMPDSSQPSVQRFACWRYFQHHEVKIRHCVGWVIAYSTSSETESSAAHVVCCSMGFIIFHNFASFFFCLNLLPTMQTAPKRCEAECKECVHDALCMTQKFHEASTRCLQKFMKDLHYFLKSIFFMRCLKTIRILKKSITPTTDYCLARIMNIVKVLSSSKKVSIENSH